jgi:hypothetical protein
MLFGPYWVGLVLEVCARRNQFGNADQVVGDQVEHEVGRDARDAAVFGLVHRAVLFAPSEQALDHRPARLRHSVALMAGGASVDGALATPGTATVVLRDMRRDVHGAQRVDQDVPLATFDLLARVVARRIEPSPPFCAPEFLRSLAKLSK